MATGDDTPSDSSGFSNAAVGGTLSFLAGAVAFMGIVTAEVLYPDYSTRQDISDLGSTLPPDPIIHQPSATIFNATMLLTGGLLLVATLFVHRSLRRRLLTVPFGAFAFGVFGVGLFPGNVVPWHGLFALLTFFSGGVTAVLAWRVLDGPFRHLSLLVGLVSLLSLLTALFFAETELVRELGSGGIERWVAYPLLLWVVGFGGYLLGSPAVVRPSTD